MIEYDDDNDVCSSCIKSISNYLQVQIEQLDQVVCQLRWLFIINCISIISLVIVGVTL